MSINHLPKPLMESVGSPRRPWGETLHSLVKNYLDLSPDSMTSRPILPEDVGLDNWYIGPLRSSRVKIKVSSGVLLLLDGLLSRSLVKCEVWITRRRGKLFSSVLLDKKIERPAGVLTNDPLRFYYLVLLPNSSLDMNFSVLGTGTQLLGDIGLAGVAVTPLESRE